MKQPKPLPALHPTAAQFEKWKNSNVYGVWLNDKRIKNEELNKYTEVDFSYYNVSKLSKNAINYGKHYYQVTLMTNAHYDEYVINQKAKENEPLMYIKWISKPKNK
jgi:bla regulator protein blaR1